VTLVAGIVFVTANATPVVCTLRQQEAATPTVSQPAGHHAHGATDHQSSHGAHLTVDAAGVHACGGMTACCHTVTGIVAPAVPMHGMSQHTFAAPLPRPLTPFGVSVAPATPPPRV